MRGTAGPSRCSRRPKRRRSPTAFVLDNSVLVAWLLGEPGHDADRVVARLSDMEAHVPSLWPVELTHVLVVAERRGRITDAQAARAVEIALALPIRVSPPPPARRA